MVKSSLVVSSKVLFVGVFLVACTEPEESGLGAVPPRQAFLSLRTAESSSVQAMSPSDRDTMRTAALRLCDLQADRIGDNARNGYVDPDPDDGGWDWTLPADGTSHLGAPSPANLYGMTALGLWAADRSGLRRPRSYTAMLDTSLGIEGRSEVHASLDFVYLVLLAELSDDAGFAELARQRYDGRLAASGGALALGEAIREARHAQGYDGLIPYDLALSALGAAALHGAFPGAGYDSDATAFATIANDDLRAAVPYFDIDNSLESYYVQGLAWSLVTLSWTASAPEISWMVRRLLLGKQGMDGSWGWNDQYPEPNLQATAHAVQALKLVLPHQVQAASAAHRGAGWLASQQRTTGGWEPDPGVEYPSLDGEIMLALYLSRAHHGGGLQPPGATSTSPGRDGGEAAHQRLQLRAAAPQRATPPLAAPLEL